jgi:hypothetical protein
MTGKPLEFADIRDGIPRRVPARAVRFLPRAAGS